MQRKVDTEQDLSEVPAAHRRQMAKPLEYYARKYADRDEAIAQAYAGGGYGMKEIGAHFGLHYSRVSRIIAGRRMSKGKPHFSS